MRRLPLNGIRLHASHLGFFMTLNHQVKKGVTVLSVAINPNYKVEKELALHSKGREDQGNPGILWATLSVLMSMVKTTGRLEQPPSKNH